MSTTLLSRKYDEYPVCTLPITPGDRFLLYAGATEPENANGGSFGDKTTTVPRLREEWRHREQRVTWQRATLHVRC
jgi:hypothetical protein